MGSKTEIKARKPNSPKARPQTRARAEVRSDDPLYLQVVRALKDEIVSGVYPVGSQLPTEEELCDRFSVSRYTVREALRRLREDNLVVFAARSGNDRGSSTSDRLLRPRGHVDQRPGCLRDRRALRDRHHRDDRDRRQARISNWHRERRRVASGARLSPHRRQRRSGLSGQRSTSTGNLPPSAVSCNATPARSFT